MKTSIRLTLGLVLSILFVYNLNLGQISKQSFKSYSLLNFKSIVQANAEDPCVGGGILGYDESTFVCSCGLVTIGCLSMVNYCCGVSDNCDELCKDHEIITGQFN